MSAVARLYLGEPLRVLALWQPWATLCVAPDPAHAGFPAKEHETRHWAPRTPTPIRVVIHAAKKCDGQNLHVFTMARFKDALERCGYYGGDPRPFLKIGRNAPRDLKPVPLGCLIGVATIDYVRATEVRVSGAMQRIAGEVSEDDLAFGDYSPSRFAWHLTDVVALPRPIPFSGKQDPLYLLNPIGLDAVRAQLRELAGEMEYDHAGEDGTRVICGQATL